MKFTTIRLVVPKETIVQRICAREKNRSPAFLRLLNYWLKMYYDFAKNNKNYISFVNNDGASLKQLVEEINQRLK